MPIKVNKYFIDAICVSKLICYIICPSLPGKRAKNTEAEKSLRIVSLERQEYGDIW